MGANAAPQHVLTDTHVRGLLHGHDCITSLSLCWRTDSPSDLHLLARFGNLRQLELHLDEADGLMHMSSLKGLLELHLSIRKITRPRPWCYSNCSEILKGNKDSLLHVSLSAHAWHASTYWALLHLSKLRTFRLAIHELQPENAEVLIQLRLSQSMSVAIHKLDQRVVRLVPTMHNLTTLTLVGLDLTSVYFQPQSTLQALTLRGVCIKGTQLKQMVQNFPSLKQLNLQRVRVRGLRIFPETLCTILRLRNLSTLGLGLLGGLTAATVCRIEAFIRAQQSAGMAQPKIHVTCWLADEVIRVVVDYTRSPVLCGAEFDGRMLTHTQRSTAQVMYLSARAVSNSLASIATFKGASANMLQRTSGRLTSHADGLVGMLRSHTWKQVESMGPLGSLVAVAIVGINVACVLLCVSNRPTPAQQRGSDI